MKNKILSFPLALIIALVLSSCGGREQKPVDNTDKGPAPKELIDMTSVTSYYECPMKCENKKFAEAGNCPICGMELVKVETKSDSTSTVADTTKMM